MRKLTLILSTVFVFGLNAAAQNRTINGKVTDEKGAPIEGVSVTSPNGKQGTQTEKDGTYSISIPATVKTLIFTYVNFVAQTKSIGSGSVIDVSLRSVDSKLEEVVVVGYGTQKKREVTGSLSAIKGTAVANKPVQSFEQALAGRAPGVQITIPNGVLNNPPVFRIRGTNSISLNSQPLVVVDGVPSPVGDFSSSNAGGNALASINPADIESIDVAKDAAATAIYGSRAANGVVFITTKKGKQGKARVNYNASFGFTSPYGIPQVLNAQQYTDYKNMAVANNQNLNPVTNRFNLTPGPDGNPIDTKWADYVYRNGFSQDHNLSISGANENTSYYFSAGYTNQEGILKGNDFTRKNVLMNIENRFNKRLTLGGKISYSNEMNASSGSSGSIAGEAFNTGGFGRIQFVTAPNIAPYKNDGTYNISTAGNFIGGMNNTIAQVGFYNPVVLLDQSYSNTEIDHIQGNVYLQFKPFNWLTLRSTYGIDYLLADNNIFLTPLHGDGFASVGSATGAFLKAKRWTWSNTAQVDYSVKQKHNISLLAGYEQDRRTQKGYGINRTQVSDPVYNDLQAGWAINNSSNQVFGENYLRSVFGRVTYDFNKKYFLTANLRQDEYSALPNQKETFWGLSVGWNVANEKFWGVMKNVFSSFRLHSSYGKVGNTNGILDYQSYTTYNSGLYGGNNTLVFNQAGNPDLKWETSKKFDAGINLGIIRDRITADLTYFKNDISNLILFVPQAPSVGLPTTPATASTIPLNVGKMYNKGFEIDLNIVPFQNNNFTWTMNFNYTTIQNRVTELTPTLPEVLTTTSTLETINRTAVGYSVGSLWLVRTPGVDPATGSRILLNQYGNQILYRFAPRAGEFNWSNTDGTQYRKQDGTPNTITQAADAYMFNAQPKFYGGLNNSFRYKSFDLDILLTYQGGNYVYYGSWAGLHDQRFWNNHVDVLTAWKKFGDITTVPRPVYGDNLSNGSALPMTYSMFKGDFIKIKNVTFGYNIPAESLKKMKIASARFYVSGSNLHIFTKYPGPDPEVSSNGNISSGFGIDRNTIANGRTITVGVNIGL